MTDSMTDVREVIENVLYLETEMERYECAAKADAILSALSSHGLKVVGREPTREMLDAAKMAQGFEPLNDAEWKMRRHSLVWQDFCAMWDAAE